MASDEKRNEAELCSTIQEEFGRTREIAAEKSFSEKLIVERTLRFS